MVFIIHFYLNRIEIQIRKKANSNKIKQLNEDKVIAKEKKKIKQIELEEQEIENKKMINAIRLRRIENLKQEIYNIDIEKNKEIKNIDSRIEDKKMEQKNHINESKNNEKRTIEEIEFRIENKKNEKKDEITNLHNSEKKDISEIKREGTYADSAKNIELEKQK